MTARRNLVASALGNGWSAIVQVAFVPVYIGLLGLEAYGLIGFYAVLQVSLWILDLGLTPAVSREVARARAGAVDIDDARALLRSIECVFAAAFVGVVAVAVLGAPWVAEHWLKAHSLALGSAVHALQLMGALIAVRLFVGVHRGAITGAQQLVWLNAVASAFATLRGAGVVPVLWFAPSIEAFFLFQLGATALESAVMARKAWSLVPSPRAARPSRRALAGIRGFSAAMIVITTLYVLLTQADKALLSAVLPLGAFGEYALAGSVAAALGLLAAPAGSAAYPRLTELLARKEPLHAAVRGYTQVVTVAVAPAAAVLALFAQSVLLLWTRDAAISLAASPLLALLALGFMLHAFTTVPYLLPLAEGRPRGAVLAYVAMLTTYLPTLVVLVGMLGAVGAALAWIALNAAGVALCWPLMGNALTSPQRRLWVSRDVALPTVAAFGAAAAVRSATSEAGGIPAVAAVALAYGAALCAAVGTVPAARAIVARAMRWDRPRGA